MYVVWLFRVWQSKASCLPWSQTKNILGYAVQLHAKLSVFSAKFSEGVERLAKSVIHQTIDIAGMHMWLVLWYADHIPALYFVVYQVILTSRDVLSTCIQRENIVWFTCVAAQQYWEELAGQVRAGWAVLSSYVGVVACHPGMYVWRTLSKRNYLL